jgi:transposase
VYIRESRKVNKKNGEVYTRHHLVEAVRTDKGPRQRVVMPLGQLTLPKSEWKKPAHALECQLSNQVTFLGAVDQDIETLALKLISNNRLSESIKEHSTEASEKGLITIDAGSLATSKSRTLGAELVCRHIWELPGFEGILKKCGLDNKERILAGAVIFGRLVSPGSERHTFEWFSHRTALPEFPGADISALGKDRFYEIGDTLYDNKDKPEELLFHQERKLFPFTEATLFLYDLTNTYMEGSNLGNNLAARGHCKSKRTDCPLITLSLLVSDDGMPLVSHVYKGNQSEPETMEGMIKRVETLMWGEPAQLPLIKPVIVMDRGIATADNVTYLQRNGYSYIVVRREDESEEYRELFEAGKGTFTCIKKQRRSAYGDENNVYVKRLDAPDDAESSAGARKVLCISEGKARKERAIDEKRNKRFIGSIESLTQSIKKGTIKKLDIIQKRLDEKLAKHKTLAKQYSVELVIEDGKATGISIIKNPCHESNEKLYGCYVIESTLTHLDEVALWNLYMTQSKVEDAFRAMKGNLGMRPVYHQNAERCSAHLFMTVLGYHILATLNNLLEKRQDNRDWSTIRDVLSTHMRSTIIMKDESGKVIHVRVSGLREEAHLSIYSNLGVKNPLKTVTYRVKTDP